MDADKLLSELRKSYLEIKDSIETDNDLFISFLKKAHTYIIVLFNNAESTPAGKRWLSGQLEKNATMRTFYKKEFDSIKEHYFQKIDASNKEDIDKFCKKLLLELEKLIQSGNNRYI